MLIETLITAVNAKLAGELLTATELTLHVDATLDEVNSRLNTKFPSLSECLDEGLTEYIAIPDKYLRSVIVPGAAFHFFTVDEEGANAAPKYEEEYIKNLFYMERDFMPLVPEEYVDDDMQGHLYMSDDVGTGGLTFDGSIFRL